MKYQDVGHLIPFLLGNGLDPETLVTFLRGRASIKTHTGSDWGTVKNWISKFKDPKKYPGAFYYDLRKGMWLNANGTQRKRSRDQ